MRVVDFADGAQSETTPVIGNIKASALIEYPDDATYEATEQGAPQEGNIYFNTTDKSIRYYNGTIWQELIDEQSVQVVENKFIDADLNTITNIDNNEIKPLAGIEATKIADGCVDDTEFQYLDGVTSPIQTQLDAKQNTSEKDQPNGYAGLDGNGRISESALPVTALIYRGTWDASTNTPTLADGVGTQGDVYRTSVAGTQDLGSGPINFAVGDWVTYNGSIWQRSDFEGAGVLNDLQDVDTTGVVAGQALIYNGTTWVPGTIQNVIQENVAFIGKGTGTWTQPGTPGNNTVAEVAGEAADVSLAPGEEKGFTFTPNASGDLVTVQLYLVDRGTMNGDGNVEVDIYATSGGLPTGSALFTSTTSLSTNSGFAGLNVVFQANFNFGGTENLVLGTEYAAIVRHTDTGTVTIRRDSADDGATQNVENNLAPPPDWLVSATQESITHTVVCNTLGAGQLVLDDNSFVSVPPLANDRHQIDAQTIELANGQAAYINIDRAAASATSRTVIVDDITNITPDNNIVIIARCENDECYLGIHDPQRFSDGDSVDLQKGGGASGTQTLYNASGFLPFGENVSGSTSGTLAVGTGGGAFYTPKYRIDGSHIDLVWDLKVGTAGTADVVGAYIFPLPPGFTPVGPTYQSVGEANVTLDAAGSALANGIGTAKLFGSGVIIDTQSGLLAGGDGRVFNNANSVHVRARIEISGQPTFVETLPPTADVVEISSAPFAPQNFVAGVAQDIVSFILPVGTWDLTGFVHSNASQSTPASPFDYISGLGNVAGDVAYGNYTEGTLDFVPVLAQQFFSAKNHFYGTIVSDGVTTIYLKHEASITTTSMRLNTYYLRFRKVSE